MGQTVALAARAVAEGFRLEPDQMPVAAQVAVVVAVQILVLPEAAVVVAGPVLVGLVVTVVSLDLVGSYFSSLYFVPSYHKQ